MNANKLVVLGIKLYNYGPVYTGTSFTPAQRHRERERENMNERERENYATTSSSTINNKLVHTMHVCMHSRVYMCVHACMSVCVCVCVNVAVPFSFLSLCFLFYKETILALHITRLLY